MEKRYQVFVSSTYDDLLDERQEVMQALLELDCIPSGMELFPAADDDQWTLIKRVIDYCDYYVVAGRYGSCGPDGKSYTEMEYEYAVSKGNAFLHADPGKIQADKTDPENREKLKAFRDIVQKKMCKMWSSSSELGSVVSRSIIKLIKDRPGVGWVRADLVPDESAAREILRLRNENDELRQRLEQARSVPPKGSEEFAQGNEKTGLHFRFDTSGSHFLEELYTTAWNELFVVLSPRMIDGASEGDLKDTLADFFRSRKLDLERMKVFHPDLRDEDFQRVKVQFRALGLITKDERKHLDNQTYWMLTPYGDTLMTQVAAIRSGRP